MDTGRFILAIALMMAVIIGTNLLFRPDEPVEPLETPPPAVEDVEGEREAAAPSDPRVEPVEPTPAEPDSVRLAEAEVLVAESPLQRLGVSDAGGAIVSAELLDFESFTRAEGAPVELVPDDAEELIGYRLQLGDQVIDLDGIRFTTEEVREGVGDGSATELRLLGEDPARGVTVELDYTLHSESYLVGVSGRVEAPQGGSSTLLLDIGPTIRVNERNPDEDYQALKYVVNARGNGIRSARLESVTAERVEEGPLTWVALANKYFLVAALSTGDELGEYFGGVIVRPAPGEHEADLTATVPVARDGTFSFELFLGPQEYGQLTAAGRNLENANPYGYRIFRPIIQPLARVVTWALVNMQQLLGIGYGWVLILFGLIMRVVLWPLNARAMRSQLKNMALQPILKETQEKYKNDPQRLQKEMMRLYKEEGFNPLAGCLPMLVPMPVLITLFFVFRSTIEFRGVPFLWLPDLSQADPYYILPVLLGVSMFLLQWMSLRASPTPNPQMKMMMWIMPVFMVVIFVNLASGLNLYYTASNIATFPQQLQLSRERRRAQLKLAGAGGSAR